MKCERCQVEEAVVFLTQVVQGEQYKVDLCEACAKELGVADMEEGLLAEFLLNFEIEKGMPPPVKKELFCPACGYTLSDMKGNGKLGCPECYGIFEEYITGALDEFQRSGQHRGKVPKRQVGEMARGQELAELEKELEKAVKGENFEKAGWLRDQIRSLKANE